MIDPNSMSYPYLGLARSINVPYGEVLSVVDELDASAIRKSWIGWHREVHTVYAREQLRQKLSQLPEAAR